MTLLLLIVRALEIKPLSKQPFVKFERLLIRQVLLCPGLGSERNWARLSQKSIIKRKLLAKNGELILKTGLFSLLLIADLSSINSRQGIWFPSFNALSYEFFFKLRLLIDRRIVRGTIYQKVIVLSH